jgi:ATP-dependent Clp protease adapter protein ClpS
MDEENEVTKEMMIEFGLNLEGENNSTYKEYSKMLTDLNTSLSTIDNFMDSAMTGVEDMDNDACIRHMEAVLKDGVGVVGGFEADKKDLTTMINKARKWREKGKNPGKELDLIKVYLQRKMITQKVLKGMNAEKPNIAKAGRCLLASLTHSMGAPLRSTTIIDGSLQKDSDGKYHRAHAADAKQYTSESLRAFIDTEPTDEDKGYTHKSGSTTIDIHADGKINFERNGTKLRGRVTASRENMKKFANLDYLGGKKVTYTDKTKQRNPSENYLKDFLNNQQNILENLFNYINQ